MSFMHPTNADHGLVTAERAQLPYPATKTKNPYKRARSELTTGLPLPATSGQLGHETNVPVETPESESKSDYGHALVEVVAMATPIAEAATSQSKQPEQDPEQQQQQSGRPPTASNEQIKKRPPLKSSPSQMESKYVNMLLAIDGIPPMHNIAISFFTWILLAGFVLFPGTFTSLQSSLKDEEGTGIKKATAQVLNAIQHIQIFVIAWVCCGIGTFGMLYMWWRWMNNYVWLVNRIFIPGCLNSLTGLISTLVNVYGAQHGQFSTTSKMTLIVTASAALINGVLTLFYQYWKLGRVKLRHKREIGKQRTGKHGEGYVEQRREPERAPV